LWDLWDMIFWAFFSGGWMEVGSDSYWTLYTDQTLITGDKSGSFDLTTTGTVTAEQLTSTDDADINDVLTCGSLITDTGGITLLGGQDIRPSADSTTAINIAQANGTDFVTFDTTNKRVGIGTTSPQMKLEVNGNGLFTLDSNDTTRGLYVEQYYNDSHAALIGFKRARGTKASPTALSSGDNIGFFRTQGYDGSVYQQAGYFGFSVDGTVSSGSVPTAFVIATGTASYGTERLRITNSGNVGIGTTSPTISDGIGLDINGKLLRLRTAKTPANAGDTGNAGEICWDSNYLYVCVGINTWKRVALNTW